MSKRRAAAAKRGAVTKQVQNEISDRNASNDKLRSGAEKMANALDNLAATIEQDGMTEAEAISLRVGAALLRDASPAQVAHAIQRAKPTNGK